MPIDDSVSEPNSIDSGGSLQLSGGTSAPSAVAEGTVVINNEALEQTRNLSQRCSVEAIGEYSELKP